MRFSEKWLREWVNPPVSRDELAAQLTMAGLEVDAVEPVAPDLDKVVVGRVTRVEPHPNADRLRVCQVDVGECDPLTIVCGAPNVHEGMRAPTALVGARLAGGLSIKRSKLRGVQSSGMLCSAKELGMADDAAGLMPLPEDAPPGALLPHYLDLDDAAIEIDLTPNRGDCLSVAGVAREVGTLNRVPVSPPPIEPVPALVDDTFPVALEAPAACPRYVGRVIRGVDPQAPTPLWMRERLRRSGLRSLGPLVDVTNYVLLELGQPMHAFDLRRLAGGIHVRQARAGETLTLLDGKEVPLAQDTLVIADADRVLALAGIMGGLASGVQDDTTDLFLESAFFAPDAIIGRPRRYGLQTDSSYRFERGVDPQLQRTAMERATRLLLDIVGGRPGPIIEAVDDRHLPRREPIGLRPSRIRRLLGTEIPGESVHDVLTRLGMEVAQDGEQWRVVAPSFRFDMAIETDLIEEVARIHGYQNLPTTDPVKGLTMYARPEAEVPQVALRRALTGRGYQEVVSYSFVDPGMQAVVDPEREAIALANPLSADLSVMRTSLWSGLLSALRYNQNRQQPRVRVFEAGLVFRRGEGGEIAQRRHLGGAVWGALLPEQWGADNRPVDIYDIKGDVEALLGLSGRAQAFSFQARANPTLHPGQSAVVLEDGEPIGWLGALHPTLEGRLDIAGPVYLFELALDALQRGRVPVYRPVSRFPAIRRDLAVVVEGSVAAAEVAAVVREAAGERLADLKLFDVYAGKGIDPGRKSLALGLTLQDPSRTLTDTEVEEVIQRIVRRLAETVGATLRD